MKEQIAQYGVAIEQLHLHLVKAINTHTHVDHVTGLGVGAIAGGIAGGWIGAILAKRLAHQHGVLNAVFALMLIAIAIYMLIRR